MDFVSRGTFWRLEAEGRALERLAFEAREIGELAGINYEAGVFSEKCSTWNISRCASTGTEIPYGLAGAPRRM